MISLIFVVKLQNSHKLIETFHSIKYLSGRSGMEVSCCPSGTTSVSRSLGFPIGWPKQTKGRSPSISPNFPRKFAPWPTHTELKQKRKQNFFLMFVFDPFLLVVWSFSLLLLLSLGVNRPLDAHLIPKSKQSVLGTNI